MTSTPWFKKGLRFKCTGCGHCCTGSPGYVFLSQSDFAAIADHLQLTHEEFSKRYIRIVDGQPALLDTPGTDACIFLKNNKCSVYNARPVQCRTFPWWIHSIRTPKDWAETAQRCEGINHPDAPVVPALEIETQCATYLDNLIDQNFED